MPLATDTTRQDTRLKVSESVECYSGGEGPNLNSGSRGRQVARQSNKLLLNKTKGAAVEGNSENINPMAKQSVAKTKLGIRQNEKQNRDERQKIKKNKMLRGE